MEDRIQDADSANLPLDDGGKVAAYVSIVVAALLFGVAGALSKFLFNQNIDPMALTILRTIIAAVILMLAFRLSGTWQPLKKRDLPISAAIGLLTFGVTYTFYKAIAEAGVAIAIMLQYTAPIFVILIEALLFRKGAGLNKILSIVISTAGCFLLVKGYDSALLSGISSGILFGLGCGLLFAIYNMLVNHAHGRGMSEQYITAHSFLFSALVAVCLLPTIEMNLATIDRPAWLSIIIISIFATVLPYKLYISGLRIVPAFQATLIGMLDPVSAAIAAAFFLDEHLDMFQVIGIALIIFAVLLSSRKSPA